MFLEVVDVKDSCNSTVFNNFNIQVLSKYQKWKQPPEVFYVDRCSYKFHKIHRKTSVPESLF